MSRDLWVMVADAGRARIFAMDPGGRPFNLVDELVHSPSRLPAGRLVSDDRGRTRAGPDGPRSGLERRTRLHEREERRFAHRLACYLDEARRHERIGELALIAPPRFLGMLRQDLDPLVVRHVVATLDQDLSREVPERIQAAVMTRLGAHAS